MAYDPLCTPVGIKEESSLLNSIRIYPNPASEKLFIKADFMIDAIDIYDMVGRKVLHQTTNNNQVNVDFLVTGNYLLKCKSGNQFYTFSFSKR